jgi:hypothetical protein
MLVRIKTWEEMKAEFVLDKGYVTKYLMYHYERIWNIVEDWFDRTAKKVF